MRVLVRLTVSRTVPSTDTALSLVFDTTFREAAFATGSAASSFCAASMVTAASSPASFGDVGRGVGRGVGRSVGRGIGRGVGRVVGRGVDRGDGAAVSFSSELQVLTVVVPVLA